MSIPESQLETWCNQGATVTSAAAYTSIKTALGDPKSKVRDLNPEIYLQGSYGNSTNIFADSDVDIVVQYNSVYDWDVSSLPLPQQMLFAAVPKVNHSWKDFHAQVVESLRSYYGVCPGCGKSLPEHSGVLDETGFCARARCCPQRRLGSCHPWHEYVGGMARGVQLETQHNMGAFCSRCCL